MVNLALKRTEALLPTDILFQTHYWAQVKSHLGAKPLAFDIASSERWGDVLVLIQPIGHKNALAYVPQGPEYAPSEENYGTYLEDFSENLANHLDKNVAFIRFDLPWKSQYANEIQKHKLNTYPERRIREFRMNMGTRNWNIRKAALDMNVASTLIVDVDGQEDQILSRMKAKTRYNIGLAKRKGVRVDTVTVEKLPEFYSLYCQTARRNGFKHSSYEHFIALFQAQIANKKQNDILFLLARQGNDTLAGAIIAISGKNANFLYGASADIKRNYMGSYALHWHAMQLARDRECTTYEMGAISPGMDSTHHFYGLYRFKIGFGGRIELRSGSWDYPLDHDVYQDFCNSENLDRIRIDTGSTEVQL